MAISEELTALDERVISLEEQVSKLSLQEKYSLMQDNGLKVKLESFL